MEEFGLSNVKSDYTGYSQISALYEKYEECWFDDVCISIDTWFDANLCSPLGGVLDKLHSHLNEVHLRVEDKTKEVLQKNSFLSYFGEQVIQDTYHTTLPYMKFKKTDERSFSNYITSNLLNRPELTLMSKALRRKIQESMYEIFVNAQMHSETEYIYVCGQFYPAKDRIIFSISDTGIGFQENIKRKFNRSISSTQAIKWSLLDGNTTKTNLPGGIGLALLRVFVNKNNGSLQIASNDGYYQLHQRHEMFRTLPNPYPGTVITVEFNTNDPHSYSLVEENNKQLAYRSSL
jgi:hypothetical protein